MKLKYLIANLFYYSGISIACFYLSRIYFGSNHIRAVNFHSTPEEECKDLDKIVKFFSKYYCNVSEDILLRFFGGERVIERPGIIFSFDDGLVNNYTVARQILEKYSFTGWFCVPSILVNQNLSIEKAERLKLTTRNVKCNENSFMSKDILVQLVKSNHVVVCHTHSHQRLGADLDASSLQDEIVNSKLILSNELGEIIRGFCWVGGELSAYSLGAQKLIESEFEYAFCTNSLPITSNSNKYRIERTNIESNWPFPMILLSISGLYDFKYLFKRKKLNTIYS